MKAQEALNVLNNTKFSVSNEAEEQKCRVYQAAFKTAIKALEKQIPKKDKFGYCPICKRTVNCACRPSKNKFCRNCGQALDWSDTE